MGGSGGGDEAGFSKDIPTRFLNTKKENTVTFHQLYYNTPSKRSTLPDESQFKSSSYTVGHSLIIDVVDWPLKSWTKVGIVIFNPMHHISAQQ